MLVRLTFCLTVIRICLDRQTKKEIKLGIRHWKKALKGCLKFIRLDRDPKLEKRISRDKFGGGNVHHVLFTKTDTGYEIQLILFSPRHIIFQLLLFEGYFYKYGNVCCNIKYNGSIVNKKCRY